MESSHRHSERATSISEGDRQAESSHNRKAARAKWERLVLIASETISGRRTIEPKGHLELVLSRIKPEPTPLYEIQRNRTDLGFISDPQARIFYLRERYGFEIENRIDRTVTPAHSYYWLLLDASGARPKMRHVEFAPEKSGKPRVKQPAPVPPANEQGQFVMFGAQHSRPADDFPLRERGDIR